MLERTLEPEVMDSEAEARDYDQMDHSQVNRIFVEDFLSSLHRFGVADTSGIHVFDAGTGTALIPIELMQQGFAGNVTASDLAESMLAVARRNVQAADLSASINVVLRDCKQLPEPEATYDAVMSNSIVHHIPDPGKVLAELWRVLKPGGLLFVRDLVRPASIEAVEKLVLTYAGDSNEHQQRMFRESLHAALTVDEVAAILQELGVDANSVKLTSDRHWTICCRKS
ncbi:MULTISPECIES: class I SAM-dependent methyltransferase [unclassified Schlesneria]|uniref:class I SAM-dependent methyltransferase n=1 Tax=unclassified Schlesneria TaxID=2762017 RepID=UPI002F0FC426